MNETLAEGAWVLDTILKWRPVSPEHRRCRISARCPCPNPPVAEVRRGRTRPQWWAYCKDHLYGRRFQNGRVEIWVRKGTPHLAARSDVPALCDEVLQLQKENAELQKSLCDLLARIHRDGGHYTGEHGLSQSLIDADIKVATLLMENAELRELLALFVAHDHGCPNERDKALKLLAETP